MRTLADLGIHNEGCHILGLKTVQNSWKLVFGQIALTGA